MGLRSSDDSLELHLWPNNTIPRQIKKEGTFLRSDHHHLCCCSQHRDKCELKNEKGLRLEHAPKIAQIPGQTKNCYSKQGYSVGLNVCGRPKGNQYKYAVMMKGGGWRGGEEEDSDLWNAVLE